MPFVGETIKYGAGYGLRFSAEFIFYSFLSVFLLRKGFSGTQVGALLSFSPIVLTLSLPLWARFDGGRERKIILVIASILIIAAEFLIWKQTSFALIAAFTVAYSFARAPLAPSEDSVTTLFCIENKKSFSFFRAFGSFGYIVAVFVGGYLFDRFDFVVQCIISSALFIAFAIDVILFKPLNQDCVIKEKEHSYRLLFTNKVFLLFLVLQVLFFGAMNLNTLYEVVYLNARSLPTSIFSWLTVLRVGMEILTFVFIGKRRLNYKIIFAVGAVGFLAQSACFFAETNVPLLFICDALAGIASGIFLHTTNKYLSEAVRPRNLTIAMYVLIMAQNLSLALMLFVGGVVIDAYGVRYVYLGTLVIGLAVILYSLFALKKNPAPTVLK